MTTDNERLAQGIISNLCADPEVWLTHGLPNEPKLARIKEHIVAALRSVPAQGMVMVPKVPTNAMLAAATQVPRHPTYALVWAAMLSAASQEKPE